MRILLSIAVLLLAVIAALLALLTFEHPPDKWSYGIVAPTDDDLVATLNQLGSVGWEVVAARRATSGQGIYSTASYEMILKRRGATLKSGASPPSSK